MVSNCLYHFCFTWLLDREVSRTVTEWRITSIDYDNFPISISSYSLTALPQLFKPMFLLSCWRICIYGTRLTYSCRTFNLLHKIIPNHYLHITSGEKKKNKKKQTKKNPTKIKAVRWKHRKKKNTLPGDVNNNGKSEKCPVVVKIK